MNPVEETADMTDEPARRTIAVNGVELSVVDVGSGPTVILAHGFPELAYSWRHQIGPIADAGYRVLAPDQRGYGRSTQPADVTDYDIVHLTERSSSATTGARWSCGRWPSAPPSASPASSA
jgi:pimeloyl-ACP methyl ester carboxylesterase